MPGLQKIVPKSWEWQAFLPLNPSAIAQITVVNLSFLAIITSVTASTKSVINIEMTRPQKTAQTQIAPRAQRVAKMSCSG